MGRWQVGYFQEAMRIAKEYGRSSFEFSDAIYNGMSISRPKLPNKLYKFFRPTTQNILDLLNMRLYLAEPQSFNDPFDSVVGVKEHEYIKQYVLSVFKENMASDERFTQDWYNKIKWAPLPNNYNDWSYSRNPNYEVRIYEFEDELIKHIRSGELNVACGSAREELQQMVDSVKNSIIPKRVACFFSGDEDAVLRHTAMWGHYADNGRGYCVEYDLSQLEEAKNQAQAEISNGIYVSKNKLNRLKKIAAGIFPVEYSKRRPHVSWRVLAQKNNELECEKAFWRSCLTKSTSWSKEKEYRLVIPEEDIALENYKIPFPFIKAIHLGWGMDISIKRDIISALKSQEPEISIYEYRPSPEEYSLTQQLFKRTAEWQEYLAEINK